MLPALQFDKRWQKGTNPVGIFCNQEYSCGYFRNLWLLNILRSAKLHQLDPICQSFPVVGDRDMVQLQSALEEFVLSEVFRGSRTRAQSVEMGHGSKWPNPWVCYILHVLPADAGITVKLLKESGIKPEAFTGQKNNSKGKRKIVNDRETLSFWHNKQPDPRACRQEQWAMIFRFWNIYFCMISFWSMHCRSELISFVWKLSLVHSSSLEISTNILADITVPALSAIQLFPRLILSAWELQQEQGMACAAFAWKARRPVKDVTEVSVRGDSTDWQRQRRCKGTQTAEQARLGGFCCWFGLGFF